MLKLPISLSFFKNQAKTPLVLQMEAVECGAAALAIILGYYGKYISLEEARIACGVSRNGSNAYNILQAAKNYGCSAKAYKKSIDKLRELKMPVIIFWNFNHFVVLEGLKKNKAYLNDPGVGPRVVSIEEFDESYSGLTLIIEPTKKFIKSGEEYNFFKALFRNLIYFKSDILRAVLLSILLTLPGIAFPLIIKQYLNKVLILKNTTVGIYLTLGILAALCFKFLLTLLQQKILALLEMKLALRTASNFVKYLMKLDMNFFNQRYPGELSQRNKYNERIAFMLSGDIATNLLNCFQIVFFISAIFLIDYIIALTTLILIIVNYLVFKFISQLRRDANHRQIQEFSKTFSITSNGLKMLEAYKSSGRESDYFSQWSGYHSKLLNEIRKVGILSQILAATPSIITSLNITLLIILGGYRMLNGYLSVGAVLALQFLILLTLEPVSRLIALTAHIQDTESMLRRIDDVYSCKISEQNTAPQKINKIKLDGKIELRNITFGYSRLDKPLIKDFNLIIEPGKRVAIVGHTGCGKSTLSRLISGLYQPWSGEILFDDMPASMVPAAVKMNSIALVDQEIFLFEGAVRENLSLWDSSIPENQLIAAATDANIHNDISARCGGYDSFVAENGKNYSGGQRQRLEIARALVNNPSVLILDEATSALDPIAEKIIDENLRRRGLTCVIIAHRLSAIRDSDEIIALHKGVPVERGTHNELMKLNGYYASLAREI